MFGLFSGLAEDLASLFYPRLCYACGRRNPPAREIICLDCQLKLPQTGTHLLAENIVTERFWGRMPLVSGAALYHFSKGGRAQQLIHRLKYNGKREIGTRLGESYGRQLKEESPFFRGIDLIAPVPLHPRRERMRGYNQSALFAAGLSASMGIPWRGDLLRRRRYSGTQTHKSREERSEGALNAFELLHRESIRGLHILLVDDVLTTGATLEGAGSKLLQVEGVRISIAVIGVAGL